MCLPTDLPRDEVCSCSARRSGYKGPGPLQSERFFGERNIAAKEAIALLLYYFTKLQTYF